MDYQPAAWHFSHELRPLPGIFAKARTALRRDERGSVAILAAIVFPALIGGMGLGAEIGTWYVAERKLQHAADVAAYAAAVRLNGGEDIEKVKPVALNVAKQSGFQVSGS
jgi:Flp pilus assembly protein TadG